MRIAASEQFLMAARAAGRTVVPKVSIKKTADRSELLNSGTWIDVTDYISGNNIPSFNNSLEINLSQFSAGKITLVGLDIGLWESNIFNYTDFLELKFEYIISGLTSEAVPVFSGWIEKRKDQFVVKRNERTDTCKFDVWSYPDYADQVYASTLLRQYIDEDVDGSFTSGLSLPHIPGLFIIDANVSSFMLRKGIHTISFQIDSGNKQAKLDDGNWVTLSSGSNTLVNAAVTQKVTVYAKTVLTGNTDLSDDIIVDSEGDTLPKNWYYSVSARYLLQLLFEKAGITICSFDDLQYPTRDGNPRISYMELIADVEGVTATRTSVVSTGSYQWFGVNNKLYRRSSDGQYTLMKTLTAGYKIRRILYNARNGHLWLLCGSSSSVNMDKVYVYIISSDTLSSVASTVGDCRSESSAIVDYNYTGSSYKYAFVFTDYSNYSVDEITLSGTTLTRTSIFTGGGGPPTIRPVNRLVYIKNGNEVYFACTNDATGKLRKLHVNGSGTWTNDGELSGSSGYILANAPGAYNYTDNKIYYYRSGIAIYSYQPGSSTDTIVINNVDNCSLIMSDGGDNVYANYHNSATARNFLAKIHGNTAYEIFSNEVVDGIPSEPEPIKDIITRYGGLSYDGSILWGVDIYGRLFKYDTQISLFIETARMTGMKVRGAIEKVCNSFNLVYKISSTKSAVVHRRSDEYGDVITSGNVVDLTSDNLKDISDESFYGDAYDIIKIGNGTREVNYDGSIYDAVAFDQEKVYPIDSDWIPDEILEDLAFNLYPFFSMNHKVYLLPSPAALIQYECLDGATITHSGNMALEENGIIVSDTIDKAGRPEFKVLVNP